MLRLLAFHREIQEEVFGLVRKATLQRLAEKSYASNLKITSVSLMGILSLLQGPLFDMHRAKAIGRLRPSPRFLDLILQHIKHSDKNHSPDVSSHLKLFKFAVNHTECANLTT
jgi:hypothetical protein